MRWPAGVMLAIVTVVATSLSGVQRAEAGGMAPLLLQSGSQVTVVRPDEKSVVTLAVENAIVNFDGSAVATAKLEAGGDGTTRTTVEIRDPWSGLVMWNQSVPGDWRVEAISKNGREVVLGDPSISPDAASVPKGRSATRFLMVGGGTGSKEITLPGNFVAEAFLANGAGVALIEHLPPLNPTAYRVRPLGFFGSEGSLGRPVGGLKTGLRGDAPLGEEMQGVRLNQTWNTTGDALFTLYDSTGYPNGEGVFVHALDLTTGIARCLDIPTDIDAGVGKGKVVYTDAHKLIVVGRKGIVRMDVLTGKIDQKLRVQIKNVGTLFSQADKMYVSDRGNLMQYQVSTLKKLASTKFANSIVAGTINGQTPPIVVDAKGSIWYAISDPVLRGTFFKPLGNNVSVRAQF